MSSSVALILRTKAEHDLQAAKRLADVDPDVVGDQVFGMLCEQCVEKASKSLILRLKLKYDRTHDLRRLFVTLTKKVDVPAWIEPLEQLTMFATTERYETPFSNSSLDRLSLLDLVRDFLAWSDSQF